RFKRDFPNFISTANRLETNPFPASVEVRLRPGADLDEVSRLAAQIGRLPGVADVRYDRQWIARVLTTVTLARGIGVLLAVVLVVAARLPGGKCVGLGVF